MTIEWNLILRLLIAGLLGGLVGYEREFRAKEAGLRTHFIVALGSALFMIISQYAFEGRQHDAARVAAQVVSGIGFLGAGVIMKNGVTIHGLSSAATIWCSAAVGCLCGYGMWREALISVVAILIINIGLKSIEIFIKKKLGKGED